MKIQKKVPTIKTTQNAPKYKAKTLYYGALIQGQKDNETLI